MKRKRIGIFYIIIFVFCTVSVCCPGEKTKAKNRICEMYIINKNNKKVILNVEIAESYESITTGLMFRKQLDENSGMLFVFKEETIQVFWMKNTYIPLNIAYINREGIINEIYFMKPLDISVEYPSKTNPMYALEVNKDWFAKNNITEGSRIYFNGCLGK